MRGGSFYLTGNQVHWLAGLLEAEGCFAIGSPTEPRTSKLVINMTDQDVLQAVADLLGSTVIHRHPGIRRKIIYATSLRGGSAVSLMRLIQPLMGVRRQQQIAQAIACHKLKNSYPCRVYHQIDDTLPDHDRYWLAGYMEGEGCFSLHTTKQYGRVYRYPLVQLNTTDQDVAQHVQRLWKTFYNIDTNMGCYQPKYPGSKLQYHLGIKGPQARTIMEHLSPLLFARRRATIHEILTATPPKLNKE